MYQPPNLFCFDYHPILEKYTPSLAFLPDLLRTRTKGLLETETYRNKNKVIQETRTNFGIAVMFNNLISNTSIQLMLQGYLYPPSMTTCCYRQRENSQ